MVEKETIDEAIFYHNYKEMKIDMQKYEKLEDVKDDDFRELPSYFEEKNVVFGMYVNLVYKFLDAQ